MDLTSNYTGAYLSDGKFQPSVPYGTSIPTSALDAAARLHDTAYALYPSDPTVKFYADDKFKQQADKIPGVKAALAGQAVTKGNVLLNGAGKLASNLIRFGPLGAVKTVVENIAQAKHLIDDEKGAKAKIKAIAVNDPMLKTTPKTKVLNPVEGKTGNLLVKEPESQVLLNNPFRKKNKVLPGLVNRKQRGNKSKVNEMKKKKVKSKLPSTCLDNSPQPRITNNIVVNAPEERDKYYLDTANGIRIPYTRKEYERQIVTKPKTKKFKPKTVTKANQKKAFARLGAQTILQHN
jgi:hypothetical protein